MLVRSTAAREAIHTVCRVGQVLPCSNVLSVPEAVTFRAEMKRAISDLLSDACMPCSETEEALLALVVRLADYREEGIPLYPRILIVDDLASALPILGGSSAISLGSGPRGPDTMEQCLKKCAPLTEGGWAIWVERTESDFRYGVFREPLVPVAIDLRETIRSLRKDDARAVFVGQVAPSTVEILSPGIDPIVIHLSAARREQLTSAHDEERRLAEWFVEEVADERSRESALSYATTVFHTLLRQCHGTLIAVVRAGESLCEALAADAILLDDRDDLAVMVERQAAERTSDALDELLCHTNLLGGMLRSDGAVILDTRGRVVGFNCFVRVDTAGISPSDLTGGARRRAFTTLCSLVDAGELRGVFLRSSDGQSQAYESDAND